jgi:hypothetical protein
MAQSTSRLKALSRRLRAEQANVIHAAADIDAVPARSVLERISMLESAIIAVDSLMDDELAGGGRAKI